jgi:hypothetical protein
LEKTIFPELARELLYLAEDFKMFWGEQQAVVALVTAACIFLGREINLFCSQRPLEAAEANFFRYESKSRG